MLQGLFELVTVLAKPEAVAGVIKWLVKEFTKVSISSDEIESFGASFLLIDSLSMKNVELIVIKCAPVQLALL